MNDDIYFTPACGSALPLSSAAEKPTIIFILADISAGAIWAATGKTVATPTWTPRGRGDALLSGLRGSTGVRALGAVA